MTTNLRTLSESEINEVSGGFACGGLCVIGGISAGIGFFTAGVAVGEAVGDATN